MLANSLRFSRNHVLSWSEFRHLYNPLNLQSIRWRRKPRWLPVAPSKLYKIPEKQKIPPEEYLELKTLHSHYKTEIKSLRLYFIKKTQEMLTGKDVVAEHKKIEEEELQNSLQLNDQWNKNIAKIREERIAKEKEAELELIMMEIEKNKVKALEMKEKLEAIVRKEKELSKNYITRDNIDEAIEKALSNETDYNFSIDLDGNIFKGRNTKPVYSEVAEKKQTESVV